MSKKIKIGVLLMLLCSCMSVFVPLDAKAANVQQFEVGFAEPATSDSQGYVNVLLETADDYEVWTYFWYCVAEKNGVTSPCYAVIDLKPNSFTFTIGGVGSATSAYYNLSLVSSANRTTSIKTSSSSSYTRTWDNATVVGFKIYGNVGELNYTCDRQAFTVLYSDNESAVLLRDIFSVLNESNSLDADLYNVVYSIYNSVDSVEGKLDSVVTYLKSVDSKLGSISTQLNSLYTRAGQILEEQKETNTWLEKIFDYLNESAEKQKEEAQIQGDSSVSSGNSAIEDKGGDFSGALSGLTSSMAYSGTECSWTFPEVKLPAISGVMDEVVLIRSQPIDFGQWVNAIPSGILLLIRSVLTVALIVYCFKELYDTISYLLTLRGGGGSE